MQQIRQQSGFALLIFVLLLMGGSFVLLSGALNKSTSQQKQQRHIENIKRLNQAKEALLSYAVNSVVENNDAQIGALPCPVLDGNNKNGVAATSCGLQDTNSMGYFPYKTIGLGKVEDKDGECFWYVVSGSYKSSPSSNILNWDSNGQITLVNESNQLLHGSDETDYPIALIISPGKSINQDRTEDSSGDLSDCKANFEVRNYLEGGPNINYSTDLPATASAIWTFFQPTQASYIDNVDYNDQIIAIYKKEWWQKVKATKALAFDNTNVTASAAISKIELLTMSLAECLAAYGNDNSNLLLPYAAKVDLDLANPADEYSDRAQYDDVSNQLYGRFPQILNNSTIDEDFFVYKGGGDSYCENKASLIPTPTVTAYDEEFWNHWKDHFFMVISEDFSNASSISLMSKCNTGNCVKISGKSDKLAAIVFFAGEKTASQNRWDSSNDVKASVANFLEGDNADFSDSNKTYDLSTSDTDYAYCVVYSGFPLNKLSAKKCASL